MQLNLNRLLVLLLTLCINYVCAQQSEQHIDGVYKSSDAVFVINKNNSFLIIAYGTLIKGTWKVENDLIYLKPKNPDAQFYVYGRKNPTIKNGMRICFMGDRLSSAILIGKFPDKMQPLFNDDANCQDFPSVCQFDVKMDTITLLERQNQDNDRGIEIPKLMYHFVSGDCNDFIVQHMQSSLYHNDFILKIGKEGLYAVSDQSDIPIRKSTIEEEFSTAEELKFLSESFDRAFDADFKLVNNGYNTHDDMDHEIDLEAYIYDKVKNLYVSRAIPAKQLDYKSTEYHYDGILMKFERIIGTSQPQEVIKILPTPLFIANCDN
ncbi:hypothetical protein [Sphingobacterium sp. HMA12]|uniref:hypothetical protein n=1 Tax=Sphingobacterium sp. HMA12 TaxID=2050894 RepID=UPI000CE9B64F|nr:hypothetical protein [Sphingobacterium sp. HMA12]